MTRATCQPAVLITSGNERLLNLVDTVVHYVVALENPGWRLAADADPEQAVATRRKILDRASTERIKVFGDHFPFPGVGYIIKDENAERYDWLPTG